MLHSQRLEFTVEAGRQVSLDPGLQRDETQLRETSDFYVEPIAGLGVPEA